MRKSAIADTLTVYHGLGEVLPRNLELLKTVGAEISDAGYLSCSLKLNHARMFSTSGQETVLAITLPKGAPGYQSDDEVILPRDFALRIVGSSKDGETNIIQVNAAKYSDDQPRDESGRWTAGGGTTGAYASMVSTLMESDGGFTLKPVGVTPKYGAGKYAVSVSKGEEKVLTLNEYQAKPYAVLANYLKDNAASWAANKDNHFGGWHQPVTDKIFLDVVRVVNSAAKAEKLGREHNQEAYFDFGKGQSVPISKKSNASSR